MSQPPETDLDRSGTKSETGLSSPRECGALFHPTGRRQAAIRPGNGKADGFLWHPLGTIVQYFSGIDAVSPCALSRVLDAKSGLTGSGWAMSRMEKFPREDCGCRVCPRISGSGPLSMQGRLDAETGGVHCSADGLCCRSSEAKASHARGWGLAHDGFPTPELSRKITDAAGSANGADYTWLRALGSGRRGLRRGAGLRGVACAKGHSVKEPWRQSADVAQQQAFSFPMPTRNYVSARVTGYSVLPTHKVTVSPDAVCLFAA
jgi:hypothetical protein